MLVETCSLRKIKTQSGPNANSNNIKNIMSLSRVGKVDWPNNNDSGNCSIWCISTSPSVTLIHQKNKFKEIQINKNGVDDNDIWRENLLACICAYTTILFYIRITCLNNLGYFKFTNPCSFKISFCYKFQ